VGLDDAPDPDDARRRADRFADAARAAGLAPDGVGPDGARIVELACTHAPYLATLLTRDPARLARVAADPYLHREKPEAVLADEVDAAAAAATDEAALAAALRRVRGDELVRLGVRELALGLDTEVGRELARLAGACFDAAIRVCDRALRRRFGPPREVGDDGAERDAVLVVIGMGKLGGEELNFSSDVDVIYVYSSDAGAAGPLSLHEYFAKLCAAVTAAMSEVTSDDIVFRVDLRLRPEGAGGAIANSVAQLERYYETFGRPWERQTWLKARPCAGDLALGAEVMATMRPFVYPRHTSQAVVDEVLELNRRIKRELVPARGPGGDPAPFDVKNGVGGIREIEFFVQALQLVHGRNPGLRARGTRAALDQLLFAGLVTDDEHDALGRAYRWLRHVEHLLQLEGGLQTQRVPVDPDARRVLARRLGYGDAAGFDADLTRLTGEVARLFATLGDGEPGPDEEVAALCAGALAPDRERAVLARLGLQNPAAAAAELARARRRPDSPLGPARAGALARLGPALLAEIAASADPDQALRHVVDLGARRAAAWSVWRLLDGSRPLLRLLVSILGASEYLARSLIDRPELIDLLVDVGAAPPARPRAEVEAAADRRLAAARAIDPDDEELAWSALAEHKNGQVLRIALADFAGRLDPLAVCAELTQVAEVCLDRALDLVVAGMHGRHGVARTEDGATATLAVLALGKLGGRELGYAADLDVVFVYSGDGVSDGPRPLDNVEYMTRIAQRLMTGLHARTPRGRLYDVDTRLRPSGSQGLLVSSLAGWRRYHATRARLWEHQALIKLRPVAGDRALGAAAAAAAADCVWARAHAPAEVARAVGDMRDRIERELGGPTDLKAGRGGMIDVEFAAQCVQLAHGHRDPALRTPSTAEALARAAALGVADPDDCALLADGYRFLRLVEHRLRIVHDRAVHRLPADPVELDRLARRTGFPDGAALADRLAHWRTELRAAYGRVLARTAAS
jgi:[glutamine synthetase] adenylyltransferase / [glutamine synthetase]-adenylyl-L-tyrosine phosphorylase